MERVLTVRDRLREQGGIARGGERTSIIFCWRDVPRGVSPENFTPDIIWLAAVSELMPLPSVREFMKRTCEGGVSERRERQTETRLTWMPS